PLEALAPGHRGDRAAAARDLLRGVRHAARHRARPGARRPAHAARHLVLGAQAARLRPRAVGAGDRAVTRDERWLQLAVVLPMLGLLVLVARAEVLLRSGESLRVA